METQTVQDYNGNEYLLVVDELPHHKHGLMYTASGYGAKIPTRYKTRVGGRLYRVYSTCFSNAASSWIKVKGDKIFLD